MFRLKKRSTKNAARNRPSGAQDNQARTVFSYYSGNSRDRSAGGAQNSASAQKSHPVKAKLRRAFAGLLAVAAVAFVIYSLLLSAHPVVKVGQSQASQALLQDPDVYAQAASNLIEDSLFNRNKLTFDASGLSEGLERQFAEIADATVVLPLLGRDPVLYVESFEPQLVLVDNNSAYVLDKQGRAQADGSAVSGLDELELPVVKDESGLPLNLGELVLSREHVGFITDAAYQLKAKGVRTVNMTLPPGGSELVVQVEGEPYYVRFDLYGEAREQVGRYLAAKEYFESHSKPAEYVDARVDNRVYFR